MEATSGGQSSTNDFFPLTRFADWLSAWIERPWFAYLTLLALQVKRLWGIWDFRELTGGDTCSYFVTAHHWFTGWKTNFVWSPLYTSFYGSFLYVTDDVATVTVLHRIVIVLAATMLVLAVLRKMLPPGVAWLVGAWWAVLPINFNTMYEVHLFALLPLLVSMLLVMSNRGPWARGAAVAVLVLSALLVRNESFVAAACLVAVCFWWERRQRRGAPPSSRPRLASIVIAYALPVILALAAATWFHHRSIVKGDALRDQVRSKHTINMGQVFAFGYQQRRPRRWQNRSPWVDYPELTLRKFGTAEPTLTGMIRHDPSEMMRHFLWNVRLVPHGLQLMLFGGIAGDVNPDYDDTVARRRTDVLVLSVVALGVVITGGALLLRNRVEWWHHWLESRRLGWLTMFCIAATALLVIPTQRPRPSYLFGLTVLLMTVVGMAVFVIVRQFPRLRRLRAVLPVAMVLLPVFIPSYWANATPPGPSSLLATYARLKPYQSLIDRDDRVFLVGDHAPHVENYLSFGGGGTTLDYGLFAELTHDTTLAQFLDSQKVTLFYLETRCWENLDAQYPGLVRELIVTANDTGWRMIGSGEEDGRWQGDPNPVRRHRWALFVRTTPGAPGAAEQAFEAFPGSDQFAGWYPLSGFQPPEGPYPKANLPLVQWGLGPASRLATRDMRGGRYRLEFCAMTPVQNQHVTVKIDGKEVIDFNLPAGTWPETSVPLDLAPGKHEIEFGYTAWQSPTPTHHQALLFKRLRIIREGVQP